MEHRWPRGVLAASCVCAAVYALSFAGTTFLHFESGAYASGDLRWVLFLGLVAVLMVFLASAFVITLVGLPLDIVLQSAGLSSMQAYAVAGGLGGAACIAGLMGLSD